MARAMDYFSVPAVCRQGYKDLRVILLDLKLPKISGLEVLQNNVPTSSQTPPVVVLTSSAMKKM